MLGTSLHANHAVIYTPKTPSNQGVEFAGFEVTLHQNHPEGLLMFHDWNHAFRQILHAKKLCEPNNRGDVCGLKPFFCCFNYTNKNMGRIRLIVDEIYYICILFYIKRTMFLDCYIICFSKKQQSMLGLFWTLKSQAFIGAINMPLFLLQFHVVLLPVPLLLRFVGFLGKSDGYGSKAHTYYSVKPKHDWWKFIQWNLGVSYCGWTKTCTSW